MSVNEKSVQRMKALIGQLKVADIAYYRDDNPIMSDKEYDRLTRSCWALSPKRVWFSPALPPKRYPARSWRN